MLTPIALMKALLPQMMGSLRVALQKSLVASNLAPVDLLFAWNKDGDDQLSKHEFLMMMKRLLNDEARWESTMRHVPPQAQYADSVPAAAGEAATITHERTQLGICSA